MAEAASRSLSDFLGFAATFAARLRQQQQVQLEGWGL